MLNGCIQFGLYGMIASPLIVGTIAALCLPSIAQLAPDGTTPTTIIPNQLIQGIPSDVVSGGAVRGVNLFHSFQEFNVNAGQGVYFANPVNVGNIFTRVTGSNPSNILGRLGVLGAANLFLLNPNGIVFAPNASLDIQGSFFASTAPAIQFANGEQFGAGTPIPTIVVQPTATFLGALGAITNQANLQTGQGLTLNGTTIANSGTLQAGTLLNLNSVNLVNTGTLQAGQNAALQVTTLNNAGTIQTGQNLTTTANTITNSGTIAANQSALFFGGMLTNIGTVQAGQNLTLQGNSSVNNIGMMQAGQNLSVQGTGSITNIGMALAGQNLALQGATISNAGTIQTGQNLSLIGNSVTSGGTLTATGTLTAQATTGNLTIQQTTAQIANLTASNTLLLNSSQFNIANGLSLAGATVQIADTALAPTTLTVGGNLSISGQTVVVNALSHPASVIQTGGNLTVNSSGTIAVSGKLNTTGSTGLSAGTTLQLTGSQLTSAISSINLGSTANLVLERSQLQAGTAITATSPTVLQIRDSATSPFIARAGGNITLQGNTSVDIQATNHPLSQIQTGSNLTILSPNGSVLSAIPLNISGQSTIASSGTIQLGNYTGGSLQLSALNGSILAGIINTSSMIGNGGLVSLTAKQDIAVAAINTSSTAATGNGGSIRLTTERGNLVVGGINSSSANTGGSITGSAGNAISVGSIDTASTNAGTGGTVLFTANEGITTAAIDTRSIRGNAGTISLISKNAGINTTAGTLSATTGTSGGNGGSVFLQAPEDIDTGSIFSTGGRLGGGGIVRISAGKTVTIAPNRSLNSSTTGVGDAGTLAISGRSITVNSGSQLISSTTASGNASSITLQAANDGSIQLEPGSRLDTGTQGNGAIGSAAPITLTGGAIALTGTNLLANVSTGNGTGGTINLTASRNDLSLTDSTIRTDTTGAGSSGAVNLSAGDNLTTTNSTIRTDTTGAGSAGAVNLSAGDNLTTTNSKILSSSQGAGLAGDIRLDGRSISSWNSSFETAALGTGATGNITIAAQTNGSVFLSGKIFADTAATNTRDGGRVTVQGNTVTLNAFTLDATNRGAINGSTITIAAGDRLSLENGSSLITTVAPNATGQGGDITLQGNLISLSGSSQIDASTNGAGSGGNIQLKSPTVRLSDRSELNAKTRSQGQAGSISLPESNSLIVETDSRISTAVESATGAGGSIDLNLGRLTLQSGGQLISSTSGAGEAGRITVNARDGVTVTGRGSNPSGLFAQSTSTGQAGDLTIVTPQLTVTNGAEVSVTTQGSGRGGRLTIATQRLQVANNGEISASTDGDGAGGLLTLTASRSVELDSRGRLTAWSTGAGNAGSLVVSTPQLSIRSGAELSTAATGSGMAGQITVNAGSLLVSGTGKITSRSTGTGNAGSITINLSDRLWLDTGEISASSEQGGGGQIAIAARDILLTRGSLISSSVSDGNGGGGNIILRASNSFFAFNDSDILANAQFGDGGTIIIESPLFIADLFATVGRNPGTNFDRFRNNGRVDISAASVSGTTGTVQIPDISFIQNSLNPLEEKFLVTEQLVAGSCLARRDSGRSSFVLTGTGGLAATPFGQATGRYEVVPIKPVNPSLQSSQPDREPSIAVKPTPLLAWKPGDPIQEAQGLIQAPDGRVVLGTHPQLVAVIKAQDLVCGFQGQ